MKDLEQRIKLTSTIKKDRGILRLAKEAVKNKDVERDMNHLIRELSKGNLESGLGSPGHIKDTNIFYLRGKKGARLFYHKTIEGYEIVGKASGTGKKDNEQQVIKKLKELYS